MAFVLPFVMVNLNVLVCNFIRAKLIETIIIGKETANKLILIILKYK